MALGNVLDVSDGIKNGKIRLDNIAPTLSISLSRAVPWRWVFTFDDGDGSGFDEPTHDDVSCISLGDANGGSYEDGARATYEPFGSDYYGTVRWNLENRRLLTLTVTGDNSSTDRLRGRSAGVWLKIMAKDRAGNHVWGGPGADACYVHVKPRETADGPFSLSVVLNH